MTPKSVVDIGRLIVSDRGVKGGRPCLAGTGMMVRTVAVLHMQGLSAEAIREEFPDLDLSRIYAALACYYANQAQIQADLEGDRQLGEKLAAKYKDGWTLETDQP